MISFKDKTFKVGIKILAVVVFFISLHIFAGHIVFRPLAQAQKKYDDMQAKLSATEKLIKEYPNVRDRTKEIQTKIDALKEKSVSAKELPKIIQQLTKKSSEMKMDIISIKPLEKVDFPEPKLPQGISKTYIELVARTSFSTLGDYLKALKEMSITFTVESINITKNNNTVAAAPDIFKRKDAKPESEIMVMMLISSYTIWQL